MSNEEGWPVKVHVVQDDTNQPAPTKCQIVSIPNSFPMIAGANPLQIAPDSPNRVRLTLLVNGAGATPPVVAIGSSLGDVQLALENAIGQFTGNVCYITGPNTVVDLSGTTAWWCALITAGTNPCVVSVIQEIKN
jgi:hypothetical protein